MASKRRRGPRRRGTPSEQPRPSDPSRPRPSSRQSQPDTVSAHSVPPSASASTHISTPGLRQVTVYTDGACLGNPGPGGYAAVLISGNHRRELSGGYRLTTNNRMEIMGVLAALRILKYPCAVTLYSDSKYVVDTIAKGWALRWRAKGWMRNKKERAQNADLWKEVLELCAKHEVVLKWVRGHSGIPENERCDQLSTGFAAKPNLPADTIYELEQERARTASKTWFDE